MFVAVQEGICLRPIATQATQGHTVFWKEDSDRLEIRYELQQKHGQYDIIEWILSILQLERGEHVLDVGCANGKLFFEPIAKEIGDEGFVAGFDISDDLIAEANAYLEKEDIKGQAITHDGNNPFPYNNNSFDAVVSFFALYYIRNLENVVSEIQRLLKDGNGRVLIVGPTVGNIDDLIKLHRSIGGREDIIDIARHSEEVMAKAILPLFQKQFRDVEVYSLENPIVYTDVQAIFDYILATGVLQLLNPEEREPYRVRLRKKLEEIIAAEGKLVITKKMIAIKGKKRIEALPVSPLSNLTAIYSAA